MTAGSYFQTEAIVRGNRGSMAFVKRPLECLTCCALWFAGQLEPLMVKFADAGNKKRYERREWVDRTPSEVITSVKHLDRTRVEMSTV